MQGKSILIILLLIISPFKWGIIELQNLPSISVVVEFPKSTLGTETDKPKNGKSGNFSGKDKICSTVSVVMERHSQLERHFD